MTPLISRIAAVALLVLVIGGLTFGLALPALRSHARLTDAAETARAQLAAFRAAPTLVAAPTTPLGAPLAERDPALAAAALQRRLDAAVTQAGGARLSARVHDPEPVDFGVRVAVTLEIEGDVAALRDFLHAAETDAGPTLIIDRLEVRPARERANVDAPRLLATRVTVSAFARPPAAATDGGADADADADAGR